MHVQYAGKSEFSHAEVAPSETDQQLILNEGVEPITCDPANRVIQNLKP